MSSKCVITFNLYNSEAGNDFHATEETVNTNSGYIVGPRHLIKK